MPAKNSFFALPIVVQGVEVGEIFCAWAPRAETRGKARLLFDIGRQRACALVRRTSLSPFFLVPLALFYANALLKVAPVRAQCVRARASPETC